MKIDPWCEGPIEKLFPQGHCLSSFGISNDDKVNVDSKGRFFLAAPHEHCRFLYSLLMS